MAAYQGTGPRAKGWVIMPEEQRRSTITYGGNEYKVPADEAKKVIDRMSSQVPTRISVEIGPERTLWMAMGPGVSVTVLEDGRPPATANAVIY